MSHPLHFFIDCDKENFKVGAKVTLSAADMHHLFKVLRIKLNEKITVVSKSCALSASAVLLNLDSKDNCQIVEIIDTPAKHNSVSHILLSLCHASSVEIVLEKATELGVENILLFQSERSQLTAEKTHNKLERWQKIIEAAAKQSKQLKIPELTIFKNIETALQAIDSLNLNKFVLSLEKDALNLKQMIYKHQNSLLAIGPEGDFTNLEYETFKRNNFIPLSLGNNILRSETAAIAGLVAVNVGGELTKQRP